EAFTNLFIHAGASGVMVDLGRAGNVLSLEICDNGCGLLDGDLSKSRSFGIRGLRERAGTVGGWVEVASSARGTSLILSVPLPRGATSKVGSEQPAYLEADPHDPSGWGEL
ncbi:MAG: sensor histidine kinase, partial [Rubrivivax sp.]